MKTDGSRENSQVFRPTCNPSESVSVDAQLPLLLPPQLQQESRGRLAATAVLPAQDVSQCVLVVTQVQQGGEDDAVHASGARLRKRCLNLRTLVSSQKRLWKKATYSEQVEEKKHALLSQEEILCGVAAHDTGPDGTTTRV